MHGRAHLENSKCMKKHSVSAMYGHGGRDGGHSGGCGCFSGHGRFGGHSGGCSGGRGDEGNDRSNFINGLDVSELTQNLTDEERRILVYNGGQLSRV